MLFFITRKTFNRGTIEQKQENIGFNVFRDFQFYRISITWERNFIVLQKE